MNKLYVFIILLILCSFSISCEYKQPESKKVEIPEKLKPKIPKKMFREMISIIPAPIELNFLLKDLGIQYDTLLLTSPKKLSTTNNDFQNAWRFGICMASLYYINIYEKKEDTIQYLDILYKLSKQLKISEKLDKQKIKALVEQNVNFSHLDSILIVSIQSYKDMYQHIYKQNNSDLAAISLTANHLEGLYLAYQLMKKHPNALINEKIIEQGLILEKLVELLSFYESESQEIAKVYKEIQNIFKIYQEEVDIKKLKDRMKAEEIKGRGLADGLTYQRPQLLSNQAFNKLSKAINQLRNKMLK